MKNCPFCGEEVQDEAVKCKHCKEWFSNKTEPQTDASSQSKQFENQKPSINIRMPAKKTAGNTESTQKKRQLWKAFSWKVLLVAFLIAFILNIVLASATDTKPAKNIIWTVWWIYLTIEAWKYWRWKALIPYPAYIICVTVLGAILLAFDVEAINILLISAAENIVGLIIFYMLLYPSLKKSAGR